MTTHARWRGRGIESDVWGDGGIAVFRAKGDFSAASAAPMLQHAQAAVDDWRSQGLCANYSGARLQISEDALVKSITGVIRQHGGKLVLPTALVVRLDDLPTWRTYARLMANHGILRGVFTDYDASMRWTRVQAQIFSADSAGRR